MKMFVSLLTMPTLDVKPPAYEERKRKVYGEYKGFNKWDLAKDWLTMTNDHFFEYYGFNFVPHGKLLFDVKRYLGR